MLKLGCQHKHNGKRKITTPIHGVVVGEFANDAQVKDDMWKMTRSLKRLKKKVYAWVMC